MATVVQPPSLQITPREAHNFIRHLCRYVEEVLEDPANASGEYTVQVFYFKHAFNGPDRAWINRVMGKLDDEISALNPNLQLSYNTAIEMNFYVGRGRQYVTVPNACEFYIHMIWDEDAEPVLDALREFDTYEPDLIAPDDGYTDGSVQYPAMQAEMDARIAHRRAIAGPDARLVPQAPDSDSESEEEAEPVRQLPPVARRIHPAEVAGPADDEDPSSEDA